MSIRKETPCDFGECPYNAQYNSDCEYWCGEEEEEEEEYEDYPDDSYDEVGFNPYEGCYDYDC